MRKISSEDAQGTSHLHTAHLLTARLLSPYNRPTSSVKYYFQSTIDNEAVIVSTYKFSFFLSHSALQPIKVRERSQQEQSNINFQTNGRVEKLSGFKQAPPHFAGFKEYIQLYVRVCHRCVPFLFLLWSTGFHSEQ